MQFFRRSPINLRWSEEAGGGRPGEEGVADQGDQAPPLPRTGADLTVKMWRLFPYVEECLLLLLCVSCTSPAWHMCSLGETLAVAFQDPETVTYSIVYYNLMEQTRSEHGPEDDAQDDITGLCCCPNLKLFASASRDGSVKIWDMRNRLLRHLKLNTIPESLAFANHKGDLLVGLEQHLYLIPHSKYLPSHYEMKLLCAKFLEPLKDVSLPISTSSFEALVRENRRRLMQELPVKEAESGTWAGSTLGVGLWQRLLAWALPTWGVAPPLWLLQGKSPYSREGGRKRTGGREEKRRFCSCFCRPPMSGARRMALKESREVREAQVKLEGLSQLAKQNRDLQLLQEGKISPAKKLRFTREMREEAFGRYLQIFYRERLRLEIPEEDPFDADEVLEALGQMDPVSALCGPIISQMFLGGCTKPWFLETGSSVFADVSPSLIQASSPAIADVLQAKRKKVRVTTPPSSCQQTAPSPWAHQCRCCSGAHLRGFPSGLKHLGRAAPEWQRVCSCSVRDGCSAAALWVAEGHLGSASALGRLGKDCRPGREAGSRPGLTTDGPAPRLGTAEKSKVSVVVSVAPRTSSSPSSSRDFSRSKKSIVFREPVSPHPSQEPQKSPASTSILKSSQSSVIIKGFFPERPTSQQGLRSRAELQSQSLLLPRMSSGFIPNSVVVKQFHTLDLLEMEAAEKLVRVIGLREVSGGRRGRGTLPQEGQVSRSPVGRLCSPSRGEAGLPMRQMPLDAHGPSPGSTLDWCPAAPFQVLAGLGSESPTCEDKMGKGHEQCWSTEGCVRTGGDFRGAHGARWPERPASVKAILAFLRFPVWRARCGRQRVAWKRGRLCRFLFCLRDQSSGSVLGPGGGALAVGSEAGQGPSPSSVCQESEGSSRASLMWTFAGDELLEEEPFPVVAVESTSKSRMPVESTSKSRMPVESTSKSRMPVESTSKSRIALMSKEEVPSTKQSTSGGVFLTQLDESQYPEPAGEVPEVVLPFVDQEWFKKLFPEGFPPGMSLKDFLKRLQESLHTSSFNTKTELVGIITLLQGQLEGKIRSRIQNTLIEVLNKEGHVPSLQEKSQKQFILATLRVLLKLDRDSKELMVELMTYYMMAPAHLRAVIKDMIKEIGLYDPHNYFFKEMSSWPVGMGNRKEDVRKFSSQWLEDVIRIFQEHKAHLQEREALLGKKRSLESSRKERKSQKPLGKSRKEARKRAGGAVRPAKAAPRGRVASPLRQRHATHSLTLHVLDLRVCLCDLNLSLPAKRITIPVPPLLAAADHPHEAWRLPGSSNCKLDVILRDWGLPASSPATAFCNGQRFWIISKLSDDVLGQPVPRIPQRDGEGWLTGIQGVHDLQWQLELAFLSEEMDREEGELLEEQLERKHSLEDHQKAEEWARPWQQPVRPIDAIQYFMEMQLEKELEKMKELVPSGVESPQDTVLALPPLQKAQAILRLGETNAMLRMRIPDRFYFPYVFPRYLMKGFAPFMKLPLPKITLRPFPSPSKRPASPKTFTAAQQLVQKYFIPKLSYADSYP
ncbi:uncharacterized protein LOC103064158 [Python bivittatus]|uniref:Uncharacterized protein LOC103064158 n=1 Tax=Python bivittatus TaxID=176946 RepID=A0A9F5IQF0_PYTBI|nr:uncharacterized protein LOC103064158 [Python bivittatus]